MEAQTAFDQYPNGRWLLQDRKDHVNGEDTRIYDIKVHPPQDGATFKPQGWSSDGKLLLATDIGYGELPYPGYRADIYDQIRSGWYHKKHEKPYRVKGFP